MEERPDFLPFFAFKKIGAGGYQSIYEADAVLADFATCRCYPSVRFLLIGHNGLYDVEIVFAFRDVDIGVAGIFFFGALMVCLQSARAAFLFGEAHDCILWDNDTLLPAKLKNRGSKIPSKGTMVLPLVFFAVEATFVQAF